MIKSNFQLDYVVAPVFCIKRNVSLLLIFFILKLLSLTFWHYRKWYLWENE